jgi:AraC-like DNA-binding protein
LEKPDVDTRPAGGNASPVAVRVLASTAAIRELRVFEADADLTPIHLVPDGTVSLLLRADDRGGATLSIIGALTRARRKVARDVRFTVRAKLSPLAAQSIVGASLDVFTDRAVSLDLVWGAPARRLLARLAILAPDAAARELAAVLGERARPGETDRRIAHAAARLCAGAGVAEVARELDVSERSLRRSFASRTGLTPKRYARIARLQRVLAASHAGADWARLATELGYFDQAHLVNDFRDLLGTTPAAYVR